MQKLDGKTFNAVQANIEKLKEIFPEVFTENKVDINKLQMAIGEHAEVEKERYEFTWNGKANAVQLAQKRTTGTLRPSREESVNWDTTENLYIEGDNLEVLRILQKSYRNKVKMIYIDPPYNTGKDFVYHDNFRDNIKNYKEKNRENMKTNPETDGRYHTNWLNMMYPRLKIARNLLKDDGAIFISIDDHEETNLSKICNEIFGEDNLVAKIPWQARKSIQNDTDISSSHEYIVVYAKKRRKEHRRLKESNQSLWHSIKEFACLPLPLDKEKFSNPDNDPRGLWKADPFDAPNVRPNLTYEIENPHTGEKFLPPKGRHWRTDEKKYFKLLEDNRIVFGKSGESKPQLKVFYEEKKEFGSVSNTWFDGETYGTATRGTKEVQKLFGGVSYFDTPKPTDLIMQLLLLSVKKDDGEFVLDFFSGSATTAHAVMKLNAEDGGNRKFIMVQLPEVTAEKSEAYNAGFQNICEIGKERIRRAGKKIIEENRNKEGIDNLDIGFKVFKLDDTNFKVWDEETTNLERDLASLIDPVKEGRTAEDLVYEILLKYGIELTAPIEQKKIAGKTVYSVGAGYLFVCLERNLELEHIKKMAKERPDRIVLYDKGFKDDSDRMNAHEILKSYNVKDIRVI